MTLSGVLRAVLPVLLTQLVEAKNLGDGAVHSPLHSNRFYQERFSDWMSDYGVTFETREEYEQRLEVFIGNRSVG